MSEFSFIKAEALSNDFVIVDDRSNGNMRFTPGEIIRVCDRRLGIGADGILLLQPSDTGDFMMRTLNSDGSEAEMCGNGIRCAAKFMYDEGGLRKDLYSIETPAGLKEVAVEPDSGGIARTIRVDLGQPVINRLSEVIEAGGRKIDITNISIGNPHAVLFVNDVAEAPVATLGPEIEVHEAFPNRTNVEFVRVVTKNAIDMRVWERGAGETAACGTGAAAALVAAYERGRSDRRAVLSLNGGKLVAEWSENGHIYIIGGANILFSGTTIGF